MKVLVTGGAGFIGSHIVDMLVKHEHDVVVLDNLNPQVHKYIPNYLNQKIEFVCCDIRNREMIKQIVKEVDVIFHEASAVGVGQSMYEIEHYIDMNTRGTATMLDVIVNEEHDVKKLIIASSMSVYGEGAYSCNNCGIVYPNTRNEKELKNNQWEPKCKSCNSILKPIPTREDKPLYPASIYAMSKLHQEEMSLLIGKTYGIPTVALRYFNVFGPRQSLTNPYTGVIAIFVSRIKNNDPPIIYEDGKQSRDFIYVEDVARANLFVMKNRNTNYKTFNVGTGKPVTILDIANKISELYHTNIKPKITNMYRKGDIRHCFADISALASLGWKPKISFEEGIKRTINWSQTQYATNMFKKAEHELKTKGLII